MSQAISTGSGTCIFPIIFSCLSGTGTVRVQCSGRRRLCDGLCCDHTANWKICSGSRACHWLHLSTRLVSSKYIRVTLSYTYIYFIFSASTDFNTTIQELEFGPQSSEQQQCVNITIISDAVLEFDEVFSVVLTSSANNIRISRNSSTITILDDDSMSAWDYSPLVA